MTSQPGAALPHSKSTSVNVSITPERLELLDAYAHEKGWSRSQTLARLLDRALTPKEQP